mgnify:CR=1
LPNQSEQSRLITFKRPAGPEVFSSWQSAEATTAGARFGDVGLQNLLNELQGVAALGKGTFDKVISGKL